MGILPRQAPLKPSSADISVPSPVETPPALSFPHTDHLVGLANDGHSPFPMLLLKHVIKMIRPPPLIYKMLLSSPRRLPTGGILAFTLSGALGPLSHSEQTVMRAKGQVKGNMETMDNKAINSKLWDFTTQDIYWLFKY